MDLNFLKYSSGDKIEQRINELEKEIQQKEKEVVALCQGSNWSRIVARYSGVGKYRSVPFCVYAVLCSTPDKAYSPKQVQDELRRYKQYPHLRSIQKAINQLRAVGAVERVCAGMYAYKNSPSAIFLREKNFYGDTHA